MKRFFLIIISVVLIFVCIIFNLVSKEEDNEIVDNFKTYTLTLSGAVKTVGVYDINSDQYLLEVIMQVGLKSNAVLDDLVLNVKPTSNTKIEIPFGIININTADAYELCFLTGVAEKTADKIIAYRKITPFTSIEDIKIIGTQIYNENYHRITV